MENFPTRCLSLSQVILIALSDSFPSSIWLMGAGEIEESIVPPLHSVSISAPTQHTQMFLLPWQDNKKEMRLSRSQI